jgi:PRC-barrel domain
MAEPSAEGSAPAALKEAMGWSGFRVDDMNGARVGSVVAVYADIEDSEPAWVIVKVGRFGKVTAIPYPECADGPGRIWVAHGRKTIRNAPPIEPGEPLTREAELELCAHYFIRPDRGRHWEVAERADGAVTSKPAGEDD